MSETSPRFSLPFLVPGQAQKEAFHNEALLTLDGLVHAAVEGDPADTPPEAPSEGESWIVAAEATGAWTGRDGSLATWSAGGWRFAAPVPGMLVWDKTAGVWLYWTGGGWADGSLPATSITIGGVQIIGPRQDAIASPSGGTTIDAEARETIEALIATLKSHGLIE